LKTAEFFPRIAYKKNNLGKYYFRRSSTLSPHIFSMVISAQPLKQELRISWYQKTAKPIL
jgi:hypothetical protein